MIKAFKNVADWKLKFEATVSMSVKVGMLHAFFQGTEFEEPLEYALDTPTVIAEALIWAGNQAGQDMKLLKTAILMLINSIYGASPYFIIGMGENVVGTLRLISVFRSRYIDDESLHRDVARFLDRVAYQSMMHNDPNAGLASTQVSGVAARAFAHTAFDFRVF